MKLNVYHFIFAHLISTLWLSGCMKQHYQIDTPVIERNVSWLLLPLVNYSQTPMAGERAEAILETRLHSAGVKKLVSYPTEISNDGLPLLNEQIRLQKALEWARKQQAAYAITGSVEEWRYKSGLDGEPAVGLSLKVIQLPEEKIIWSGSAARAGWSRESLAATALVVINELVSQIRFQ